MANKLTLNVSKSVCVPFGLKDINKTNILIDSIKLPTFTFTKFLGVWLDSNLNCSVHYSKLISKLNQNVNLLKISKNELNMCTKCNIYFAHLYSHLSYGITTWGNMLNSLQLSKLQKIQNKCLSLITK